MINFQFLLNIPVSLVYVSSSLITEKSALSSADPKFSDASSSGIEVGGGMLTTDILDGELKELSEEGVRVLRGGVERWYTRVAFWRNTIYN